ncbi:glycogenin-2-like [Stegodyphus dumicola]|uniref:glycogenin-2-like n=1 Tax=Stegodyphus dumicola TaxID=202533 RepID=UPI0015AABB6F|nr:glycogenin-2-like [Stegodyphus dumicola]
MGASFSTSEAAAPQDTVVIPENAAEIHPTENLVESPEPKEIYGKTLSETSQVSDSNNGFKYSAENLSHEVSNIPTEKNPLCDDCSKVMLSYITTMQGFLDNLAREINTSKDPKYCPKCVEQEMEIFEDSCSNADVRSPCSNSSPDSPSCKSGPIPECQSEINKCEQQLEVPVKELSDKKLSKTKECRRLSLKKDDCRPATIKKSSSLQECLNNPIQQMEFVYNLSSSSRSLEMVKVQRPQQQMNLRNTLVVNYLPDNENGTVKSTNDSKEFNRKSSSSRKKMRRACSLSLKQLPTLESSHTATAEADTTSNLQAKDIVQQERTEPVECSDQVFFEHTEVKVFTEKDSDDSVTQEQNKYVEYNQRLFDDSKTEDFTENGAFARSLKEEADGILTTLSNVTDEESVAFASRDTKAEAYVTMCRNNAEVLGCLVVGTSLLLSRTSRRLCVLVTDGVTPTFRELLSSVFHDVQLLRSLDTLGTTKLALLEQPDLGISFDKLSIWRLTQYKKCVYLNPDTLVVQNCDELFNHEELSAVPDVSWPDCFNSGMFVFIPSTRTFWQLMEFADKQGSRDSGDQGLLNSFFNSWSSDINRKLSFIYNLTASVSYTYTPAFNRFGQDVKIVQFNGTSKPWHVKFFGPTGEISEISTIHPTYVQFVKMWINIFRISVLRLFPQNIQSCLLSKNAMCASDVLCFFPPTTEPQGSFYLTPPSARMHSVQNKNLQKSSSSSPSEKLRRKSEEIPPPTKDTLEAATKEHLKMRRQSLQNIHTDHNNQIDLKSQDSNIKKLFKNENSNKKSNLPDLEDNSVSPKKAEEHSKSINFPDADTQIAKLKENTLPGAEIGNYQGMQAWEQGKMDYEGSDSSENIIKRLQFLMSK